MPRTAIGVTTRRTLAAHSPAHSLPTPVRTLVPTEGECGGECGEEFGDGVHERVFGQECGVGTNSTEIECEAQHRVLLANAAPPIECEARLRALLADAAPLIALRGTAQSPTR